MEVLRKWRNENALTVEDAGRIVGVSAAQWSRYETGARRIPAERAPEIERLTGISREKLRPDIFTTKEGAAE